MHIDFAQLNPLCYNYMSYYLLPYKKDQAIQIYIPIQCIEIDDEPPEALSMAWPETAKKRLTYILVAPILVPLWLTLPDTRTPRGKKFFPITFLGSICWIAAYSYLMVWWANMIGETADISPEVRIFVISLKSIFFHVKLTAPNLKLIATNYFLIARN